MKNHAIIILASACCLLVGACAPEAKPVAAVMTAPRAVAAVAPVAASVRADAAATAVVAAKLESQVQGLQKTTGQLRDGMSRALEDAARLRDQKTATEKDLDGLWRSLEESKMQIQNLVDETEIALQSADEQARLRAAAEKNLANLTAAAAARDAETDTLRVQHDDMARIVNEQAHAAAKLEQQLVAARKDAAVGNYLKVWIAILVFLALLAIALFLAKKYYKPIPI